MCHALPTVAVSTTCSPSSFGTPPRSVRLTGHFQTLSPSFLEERLQRIPPRGVLGADLGGGSGEDGNGFHRRGKGIGGVVVVFVGGSGGVVVVLLSMSVPLLLLFAPPLYGKKSTRSSAHSS